MTTHTKRLKLTSHGQILDEVEDDSSSGSNADEEDVGSIVIATPKIIKPKASQDKGATPSTHGNNQNKPRPTTAPSTPSAVISLDDDGTDDERSRPNTSKLPAIVQFGYHNYKSLGEQRYQAGCDICLKAIRDKGSTTTNYNRHLQMKHPEKEG